MEVIKLVRKKSRNKVGTNAFWYILGLFFIVFLLLALRMSFLSLSDKVNGISLKKFASTRTTYKEILPAKRGTIYDCNGNVLAQNVSSYTLIAYLDEARSKDAKTPLHVVDRKKTAKELSSIINMKEEEILKLLSKNTYQTEFGTAGKGLSELEKEKILELKLPGLDFIESQKRYYPNGDFLSYTLGYAKEDNKGNIKGELGLEKLYDDVLSGTDGYIEYQKDANGYKIPNTNEIRKEAIDGQDIYLTVDQTVQLIVDQAVSNSSLKYKYEWMSILIADAKTGAILASTTSPSFDPNKRNLKNYLDTNVSVAYEPGSTMKIYSFMAAMENGTYKGEKQYKSGSYTASDGTKISDWKSEGWGYITYDKGFAYSSNVAAMNLINNGMSGTFLKNFYKKLGFGAKTGIELPSESVGALNFTYETEILNASFGQGITTTPIQNIQALTTLTNDGMLLKPYVIEKIVNHDNEVTYKGKRTEIEQIASKDTTDKLKDLMDDTVNGKANTGIYYKQKGYALIGKTGTAQIADTKSGGYLQGIQDIVASFAGVYPKENPEILIYASVYKPTNGKPYAVSDAIKEIVRNVSTYFNIETSTNTEEKINTLEIKSYTNKNKSDVVGELKKEKIPTVVISNGNKIINQYPKSGTLSSKEKLFLVTDGDNITMPNMKGWSKKDVMTYANLTGLSVVYKGNGYVEKQSIKKGSTINKKSTLTIHLKEKYNVK